MLKEQDRLFSFFSDGTLSLRNNVEGFAETTMGGWLRIPKDKGGWVD